MLKKFILILLITLGVATGLFYNSKSWTNNQQQRITVHEQDYFELNSKSRILAFVTQVDYAAVVYPQASLAYPNSLFHRYILGNPVESTFYKIRADVEQTIMGEHHNSIIYYSASSSLPAYPVFVALCRSENGYYAPDNGFEIPATEEAIAFLKHIDLQNINRSATACQN
ncbi:hypothetical protein [Thalassomonas sp. RHCl1]|uniref:hypothetical protein n=1 Tax=Thalassomonas sp. RHCl1 TaxID=2995320 RepID=UPI00248AABF5|nr:hypothetical protein [Thalassomonas sp. RHCl1]